MDKVDSVEQLPKDDVELFDRMRAYALSESERIFFEKMLYKEINELPVMVFDLIMDPKDNEDELFIVKRYSSEYEIGIKDKSQSGYNRLDVVPLSLNEALSCDLYELIGRHISLHQWLRDRDYRGVNYEYPWEE